MQPGANIKQPVKWLQVDFNKLKALHDEVVKILDTKIIQLFVDAKILEILEYNDQLIKFEATVNNLRHLVNLSEQMIQD